MMNLPIKLREANGLVTPKGPDFQRAKLVCIDIAGTTLCFKVPAHKPERSNHKSIVPEQSYTRSSLRLTSRYREDDEARGKADHWREMIFAHYAWAFYGPWFSGTVAELGLTVILIRPTNYSSNFSLFHPRAFETVIGDYLTHQYGSRLDSTRNNIQEYIAPVNWSPIRDLPLNAVRFDVSTQEFSPFRTIRHFVFFSLSDDLMILFAFEPSRLKNMPRSELDKRVNIQPLHDLIDQIINSVEITLSPEARLEQLRVLDELLDTSLVDEFAPLKWDSLTSQETEKVLSTSHKRLS